MKKLITKIDEYIHHTNDLTREMDTYLDFKDTYINLHTYIYDHSITGKSYGIRYPGATRGHIEVDEDNIIIDIVLYVDSCHTDKIYKKEVWACFNKYLGMKFVMVE